MQPRPKRGVQLEEHETARGLAEAPDWEAIRLFLAVARHGSFRSAAEHLGLSINVLRRRITDLETALGVPILTRHVDGVRTTTEGEQILAAAKKMEDASFELIRSRDRVTPSLTGEVRLAVTEGLGTFWLAPRMVEFQRSNPQLVVDLHCAMRSADVLRLEADVAVQLTKPTTPDLKVVKLGRLHSMPFAGRSYVQTYGMPKKFEDWAKHRMVLQVAEQTATEELYAHALAGRADPKVVKFRTNVSSALVWAISKGAGIGWLPTYIHAISRKLTPIDLGLNFPFDIWLTYHPDAARIPRVRRLIDWTVAAFDPKKFPWFRDEFIHPYDLPTEYHGGPLVNLFEGFVTANPDFDLPLVEPRKTVSIDFDEEPNEEAKIRSRRG